MRLTLPNLTKYSTEGKKRKKRLLGHFCILQIRNKYKTIFKISQEHPFPSLLTNCCLQKLLFSLLHVSFNIMSTLKLLSHNHLKNIRIVKTQTYTRNTPLILLPSWLIVKDTVGYPNFENYNVISFNFTLNYIWWHNSKCFHGLIHKGYFYKSLANPKIGKILGLIIFQLPYSPPHI